MFDETKRSAVECLARPAPRASDASRRTEGAGPRSRPSFFLPRAGFLTVTVRLSDSSTAFGTSSPASSPAFETSSTARFSDTSAPPPPKSLAAAAPTTRSGLAGFAYFAGSMASCTCSFSPLPRTAGSGIAWSKSLPSISSVTNVMSGGEALPPPSSSASSDGSSVATIACSHGVAVIKTTH